MRHKGPIITLAVGVVLGAGLMVANIAATKKAREPEQVAVSEPTSPTVTESTAPATAAPTTAPIEATYAGKIGGTKASLAIVVDGDQAVAYLCDGRSVEAWLAGSAEGGSLDLRGEDEASLTGTATDGQADGKVSAAGKTFTFSIATVTEPSGLYRAAADVRGAQLVGGWIVLADGTQVGMVQLAGNESPAPPFDLQTATVTVNGVTVTPTPVSGSGL